MLDISEKRIECANEKCGKLIAKGVIGSTGVIFIKCHSCKLENRISPQGIRIYKRIVK